jgi:uncharacterized protein
MIGHKVKLSDYIFDESIETQIEQLDYAKELWPLVYLLTDSEKDIAYVGETTDVISRLQSHRRNKTKQKLIQVHLITSELFNKSATLDIESNLIKYLSADQKFELLNGNIGISNHNYFQKQEVYWDLFQDTWNKLQAKGIVQHSLNHINNSDLFKYSPYKSLTREQQQGLCDIMSSLIYDDAKHFLIEGGAGTGKTVLAIFLFKILSGELGDLQFKEFGDYEQNFIDLAQQIKKRFPNPKIALVVPMSSFRKTLQKVFKGIKGLSPKMVIGPAEITKQNYDIVLVDEAHRLRKRVNLGSYFGSFDKASKSLGLDPNESNELEWVILQSKHALFFYDKNQSIKPSDIDADRFEALREHKQTKELKLNSQIRVKAGSTYTQFVHEILNTRIKKQELKVFKDYELKIFGSIHDLIAEIKAKDHIYGLSRLVAGYAWNWKSKKNPNAYDIEIEDIKLRWNSTNADWINSSNALEEVGCIHTTQGYDLNYTGIIFGPEITYNPLTHLIEIRVDNYKDRNGKVSLKSEARLKEYIKNIYYTLMMRGVKGTYIYACDPYLASYLSKHIPTFERQQPKKIISIVPFENAVPLYPIEVAAGGFEEYSIEEADSWINVPDHLKIDNSFFACRVVGESMNKIIPNGAICLFQKYMGGSRNGLIALVQSSDIQDSETGFSFTVKEYQSHKNVSSEGWSHERITLLPRSYDPQFKSLELSDNGIQSLSVIGIFKAVIEDH